MGCLVLKAGSCGRKDLDDVGTSGAPGHGSEVPPVALHAVFFGLLPKRREGPFSLLAGDAARRAPGRGEDGRTEERMQAFA